jgi:hypothetical protein
MSGKSRAALALRPNECSDLWVGLGLPSTAVEDAIMADLSWEVVRLFCLRDAGAEIDISTVIVAPAKAGSPRGNGCGLVAPWIPAFAGTTTNS